LRAALLILFLASSAQAQTIVAGATTGQFRVTEGGAAEYRVPVRVPPGIAGMEPRLALTYSSYAGNGLAGMGWTLEGLSAITRCPRTLAQDGARGRVAFDANDRFCLDGQRLVAVSGAYGAAGTEYRTERDSFTRVVSYGTAGSGPAWFTAWTKSGQVFEYGNTADSRVEAHGKASVRVWAVNRIADTKSNYLAVSYTENTASGEYRPLRIDYTGNATAGTPSIASVQLVYEARPDLQPAYVGGSLISQTMRLSHMRAYWGTTLVTEYRLGYEQSPSTGRSRIVSLGT
jgi:hypothetical protein